MVSVRRYNRPVTYNFDPDTWYASHAAILEGRRERGELSEIEFLRARADLDQRFEDMVQRLDGSYQIPNEREVES
jgi:hypothetical protein